jgi:four helix bundle protein
MKHGDLSRRASLYAVNVARLAKRTDGHPVVNNAVLQLARASASVAANYRAAGLARSRREFIARLGVVIEETDECLYWLDYLTAVSAPAEVDLDSLKDEGRQLLRIFTASRNTASRNTQR